MSEPAGAAPHRSSTVRPWRERKQHHP
jgi:hypothetical protein